MALTHAQATIWTLWRRCGDVLGRSRAPWVSPGRSGTLGTLWADPGTLWDALANSRDALGRSGGARGTLWGALWTLWGWMDDADDRGGDGWTLQCALGHSRGVSEDTLGGSVDSLGMDG